MRFVGVDDDLKLDFLGTLAGFIEVDYNFLMAIDISPSIPSTLLLDHFGLLRVLALLGLVLLLRFLLILMEFLHHLLEPDEFIALEQVLLLLTVPVPVPVLIPVEFLEDMGLLPRVPIQLRP